MDTLEKIGIAVGVIASIAAVAVAVWLTVCVLWNKCSFL